MPYLSKILKVSSIRLVEVVQSSYLTIIVFILLCCSLFESLQTLFWATFGLIDLENFELTGTN